MKITRVCKLPGEAAMLLPSIADFSVDGPRSNYADWLTTNGDKERANAVSATIDAYHTLTADAVTSLAGGAHWQRMLAVPLLKVFIDNAQMHPRDEMETLRDLMFANLRPAVSLTYSPMQTEPAIGTSRLWGLPDLPEGEAWPKIAEVSNWYKAKEKLPLENHCAFVGQFAFEDFNGTAFGQDLPASGGFSVFAISEVNALGIVETLVKPWDNTKPLIRRAAPQDLIEDIIGDTVNTPAKAHEIELTECLSLPDATSGPYTSEIPNCGYGEPFSDLYYAVMDQCSNSGLGFGGYLRGTSGEDPSPDTNARRFAVLRTNPDVGIVHFSIPAGDLEKGELGSVRYVWNDWDS